MHLLFQFSTRCTLPHAPQYNTESDLCCIYKWEDADYDSMNNYLSSVDWESMLMCYLTVDTLWIAFTEILQSAVDLYVSFYTVTQTDKFFHDNKWHKYPRCIWKAMSRKKCLWRLHCKSPDDIQLHRQYKAAHDEYRRLVREYTFT